mmetsp:Transcript_17633/g.22861  ORF Transcript_17633/g.22861 Transcript_17633/m.22861 type:complete len:494 (+) Transcript_17633:56-1537(+)
MICLPQCHICLGELEENIECCPCGHVFHGECIRMWWNKALQCPTCKATFRRKPGGVLPLIRLFLSYEETSTKSPTPTVPGANSSSSDTHIFQASQAELRAKESELKRLQAKETFWKEQNEALLREKEQLFQQQEDAKSTLREKDKVIRETQLDAISWTRKANGATRTLQKVQADLDRIKVEKTGWQYTIKMLMRQVNGTQGSFEEALGELDELMSHPGSGSFKAILKTQHKVLEGTNAKFNQLLEEKKKVTESERRLKQKVADLQESSRKAKFRIEALKLEVTSLKRRSTATEHGHYNGMVLKPSLSRGTVQEEEDQTGLEIIDSANDIKIKGIKRKHQHSFRKTGMERPFPPSISCNAATLKAEGDHLKRYLQQKSQSLSSRNARLDKGVSSLSKGAMAGFNPTQKGQSDGPVTKLFKSEDSLLSASNSLKKKIQTKPPKPLSDITNVLPKQQSFTFARHKGSTTSLGQGKYIKKGYNKLGEIHRVLSFKKC